MPQVNLKDATLTIKDGNSHSIAVKFGEGNLTYTEQRAIEYNKDRGILDEVREGEDMPVEVDFTGKWMMVTPGSGQTGGQVVTIEDALKKTGAASSWTSSDADPCRPYAVDLELVFDPPCSSRLKTITMPDFRQEKLSYDAQKGTISVSGKCNVKTVTVVNV